MLLVILGLIKWGQGFVANVAVLLGIVAGCDRSPAMLGMMHFDKVAAAAWFDIVLPFHFGMPKFHLVPIVTMCIVMIVVMIESLGMFLALGEMTGKKIDQDALTRGLRADGVGTLHRRHLQHLPLHLVLAERRPGRRHRRALALGHGRRAA